MTIPLNLGRPGRCAPSSAPGALGEDGAIVRRAGAVGGPSVGPRREAPRAAVNVASPPGRSDLSDGADDPFRERFHVGPAAGEAPRAEPCLPLPAQPPMAPLPLTEKTMMSVAARASTPAMPRPAARGVGQRHGGPQQEHGDGGLTQHGDRIACKGVPGARPGQSEPPGPGRHGQPAPVTQTVT